MFKSIGKTLITGIITVLPIVLTIYLLYWLVVSSEQVMVPRCVGHYPKLFISRVSAPSLAWYSCFWSAC